MTTLNNWILIVDDDPEVRTLIKRSLGPFSSDFNYFEANHGLEAINFHKSLPSKETISLIILDLDMPVCNGFELLNYLNLNASSDDTPVCIHSSNNSMFQKSLTDRKKSFHLKKGLSFCDLKDTFSKILSPLTQHSQN